MTQEERLSALASLLASVTKIKMFVDGHANDEVYTIFKEMGVVAKVLKRNGVIGYWLDDLGGTLWVWPGDEV